MIQLNAILYYENEMRHIHSDDGEEEEERSLLARSWPPPKDTENNHSHTYIRGDARHDTIKSY